MREGGGVGLEVFHHLNKRLSFWGVSQPQLPLFIHFQNNSSLFNLDRIFKASTKIGGGGVINFYVSPSLCVCVCVCVKKGGGRVIEKTILVRLGGLLKIVNHIKIYTPLHSQNNNKHTPSPHLLINDSSPI